MIVQAFATTQLDDAENGTEVSGRSYEDAVNTNDNNAHSHRRRGFAAKRIICGKTCCGVFAATLVVALLLTTMCAIIFHRHVGEDHDHLMKEKG